MGVELRAGVTAAQQNPARVAESCGCSVVTIVRHAAVYVYRLLYNPNLGRNNYSKGGFRVQRYYEKLYMPAISAAGIFIMLAIVLDAAMPSGSVTDYELTTSPAMIVLAALALLTILGLLGLRQHPISRRVLLLGFIAGASTAALFGALDHQASAAGPLLLAASVVLFIVCISVTVIRADQPRLGTPSRL